MLLGKVVWYLNFLLCRCMCGCMERSMVLCLSVMLVERFVFFELVGMWMNGDDVMLV